MHSPRPSKGHRAPKPPSRPSLFRHLASLLLPPSRPPLPSFTPRGPCSRELVDTMLLTGIAPSRAATRCSRSPTPTSRSDELGPLALASFGYLLLADAFSCYKQHARRRTRFVRSVPPPRSHRAPQRSAHLSCPAQTARRSSSSSSASTSLSLSGRAGLRTSR